jgi:hypothetical protein
MGASYAGTRRFLERKDGQAIHGKQKDVGRKNGHSQSKGATKVGPSLQWNCLLLDR